MYLFLDLVQDTESRIRKKIEQCTSIQLPPCLDAAPTAAALHSEAVDDHFTRHEVPVPIYHLKASV